MRDINYILFSIFLIFVFILLIGINEVRKNKSFKKILVLSIVSFSVLTFICSFLYIKFDIPILKIKGNEVVTINVFDKYIDDGVEVVSNHKKITKDILVNNSVNTDKVGIYDVVYSVNYYGKTISKTRKVIVEDNEKPVIELKGSASIFLELGDEYTELGYIATDNYDKDITDKVKVSSNYKDEVGKYEIIYEVEDSSGNKEVIKRIVNVSVEDNNGVVYLTFDDGPSSSTSKILDILKDADVKATFFIVNYGDSYEDMIKRIVSEGHTLAIHSYTHKYELIYKSEEAYFDDLYKLINKVKDLTGIESKIIRFPGGSSNTISSFNKGIMTKLVKAVKDKGFHYFDWNVDSRDAGGARNSTEVYNNVINGLRKNRNNVVLMHDLGSNIKTVEALPNIIKTMKKKGYSFDKITYDTPMVVHGVNN